MLRPDAGVVLGVPKPAAAVCSVAAIGFLVLAATGRARGDAPTESACNDQKPLPFLVRGNYVLHKSTSPADHERRRLTHRQAIKFRNRNYGYVDGFGDPADNEKTPTDYAVKTRFFGLRLAVNLRIVPALQCAEAEIKATCGEGYRPVSLSGIRDRNTFYNGEVSNHRYGIAIDIDPEKNVCCGCVGPAANHPVCKRPSTIEERMAMPRCWVDAFERFGFYWLGNDELGDTMHFEFLGDPSKVKRAAAPPVVGGS